MYKNTPKTFYMGGATPTDRTMINRGVFFMGGADSSSQDWKGKPADWSDIRKDCPKNSIALYAAHSSIFTKVGNPTIENGIASGFSSSDYLRIYNFQDSGNSCELNFTFTTPASALNACLFYANNFRAFFAYNATRLNIVFNSGSSQETGYIDYTFAYSTKYTVNILRNGTTAFVKIYKGTTLEKEVEIPNISAFNNGNSTTMVMGYEDIIFASPFSGSIDLNETSIKVNDEYLTNNSQYDNLGFTATCTGGYNVYIDEVQYGTTYASGAQCDITWSTSGITTGDIVTTPSLLKAHKIWISPATEGNNITAFHCARVASSENEIQGILWGHFNISNSIDLYGAFNRENMARNEILTAITSKNNLLTFDSFNWMTNQCYILEYLPSLKQNSSNHKGANQIFNDNNSLPKLIIKNFKPSTLINSFAGSSIMTKCNVKEWDLSQCTFIKLPRFVENYGILDISNNDVVTRFVLPGSSSTQCSLSGLRVSSSAPLNNATSPQIDISYTNMERQALVQLFNDLPYNVGYEVVGSPTISDGILSGLVNNQSYLRTSETISVSSLAGSEFTFRAQINSSSLPIFWMISSNIAINILPVSRKLQVKIGNVSSYSFNLPSSFSTNNYFFYKVIFDNTYNCSFYFGDTINNLILVSTHQFEPASLSTKASIRIGSENNNWSSGTVWDGSIDLNNTYIKINNVYWFRGQAAMTKTLSCVGATGTADLTQDDKDIALNKGWSLTLS